MPETITYGLIGKEDLALKQSASDTTLTVTLPDGSIVILTKISLDDLIPYGSVNLNLQQLLSMLLEILTTNPSTNTKGRLYYFDGTDDVLRYMNGSGVQEVVDLAATQTLTNKTLTSPRIGTAILDTSGNEIATVTAAASAVNQLDFRNAAVGGRPALAVTGDDANIDLNLVPKGTGQLMNNGNPILTLPSGPSAGDSVVYDGTGWVRSSTGSTGIVLAAGTGTPAQHALYRQNVPKLWGNVNSTPALQTGSYNVTSVADAGVGLTTFTIDRDFADTNYAIIAGTAYDASPIFVALGSQATGSFQVRTYNSAGALTDFGFCLVGFGVQ